MVRILKLSQLSSAERAKLQKRAELDIDNALKVAQTVIETIRERGDAGVVDYVRRFDYEGATVLALTICRLGFR